MKGLSILIRLARQRADAQRIALAEAERQALLAEENLAGHDHRMTREAEQARGRPAEMAVWAEWSRMALGQRRRLAEAASLLQAREAQLREALREDFAALKRLELAREAAEAATRRHAARRAERVAEDTELRRMDAGRNRMLRDGAG